jgi:O-antigen/teichoic acid export membrane protein
MIKKIIHSISAALCQNMVLAILPIYILPTVIKAIGIHAYGHIAVALAISVYASTIINYGYNLSGPKLIADGCSPRSVIVKITRHRFFIYIAVMATLSIVQYFIEPFNLPQLLVIGGVGFSSVINIGWLLQATNRNLLLTTSSSLAAFIYLLSKPSEVDFLVGSAIVGLYAPTINIVIFIGFCMVEKISFFDFLFASPRLSTESRSINLFSSQLISSIYVGMGPILVAACIGFDAAGEYSILERNIGLLATVLMMGYNGAYAILAQIYKSNKIFYLKAISYYSVSYAIIMVILGCIAYEARSHIYQYFGLVASMELDLLLLSFICLASLTQFGPLLTGILVNQSNYSFLNSVNIKVLFITTIVGGVLLLVAGVYGWVVGSVIAQLYVAMIFISECKRNMIQMCSMKN